jgi:hypothetical protein
VPSFSEFDINSVNKFAAAFEKYASYVTELERGKATAVITSFGENDLVLAESGIPDVPKKLSNKNNKETSVMQRSMIRLYLNKHYGKSIGSISFEEKLIIHY